MAGMPILRVEYVETREWAPPQDLAQRIADAAAAALHAPPQSVWVTVARVARGNYAENEGAPPDAAPLFVSINKRVLAEGPALAEEAAALTRAIATACGRAPGDIHLIYEPPGAGRVAFGGRLAT
jgi:phenylpyruvate tautomerase PptA (4-oxalocrotonate tautomerase family)